MVGLLYPSFPAAPRGTKINMNKIHTRHQNCRHWNPKGCRYPGYFLLPKPPFCRSQEAREEHGWPRSCRGHSHHDDLKSCTSDNSKEEMEPDYDPIEKENHLPNFYFVGSMLIFPGIYIYSSFNLAKDERWVSWKSRVHTLDVTKPGRKTVGFLEVWANNWCTGFVHVWSRFQSWSKQYVCSYNLEIPAGAQKFQHPFVAKGRIGVVQETIELATSRRFLLHPGGSSYKGCVIEAFPQEVLGSVWCKKNLSSWVSPHQVL